jgi:hypothetical protein
MVKTVFVAMALVFCSVGTFGQDAPPAPPRTKPTPPQQAGAASPCPRLEVQSPTPQNVRDGRPVIFIANISGGDPNVTPAIVWNVSAGAIKDGQGTPRIEVDSTGAGAYRQIVAELWLSGYPPECSTQGSVTVRVAGPANKLDEFGDLTADKEIDRVAVLAAALSQSNDYLYVIAYAGRGNVRGYAYTALKRLRAQFVTNGIPTARIATIDGGFREQPAFELWVVPEGAEPPRPTPTVDRKEIVYPKTTPAKKP